MILKIDDVNKIKDYEYRNRLDITEVVIGDSVEYIGEGAFRYCANLKKITIGRNLKYISSYAFDHIHKDADFIWLASIPYKSMIIRILPSFDRIRSLSAPYLSFKGKDEEKLTLACGYILQPSLQSEYSEDLIKQYHDYIFNELPNHLNELCENDSILDILVQCYQRNLIKDNELKRKFISYAKTRKTSLKEKHIINKIEDETFDNTDKTLLRYIREYVNESDLKQVLNKEGLKEFPVVLYKDTKEKAPVEALKFIMYRYMKQWSYMDSIPPLFQNDKEADYVANMLELSSLQSALYHLTPVLKQEYNQIKILYPRRIIPLLRYANKEQLDEYIQKITEYSIYDIYKKDGIIAIQTIKQAMLLNDEPLVMVHALNYGLLNEYASLRGKSKEDVFIELTCLLEKNHGDLSVVRNYYKNLLYQDYLTGKKRNIKEWNVGTLKDIAVSFLWQYNENYFVIKDNGYYDIKGNAVEVKEEVNLAHPINMKDSELRGWINYFNQHHIDPTFKQLWVINNRFYNEDYNVWKNRYKDIVVSYNKLQKLNDLEFSLKGRISESIQIIFQGKCVISAKMVHDNLMVLGEIQNSNYNLRELNSVLSLLDDFLCFEMIKLGRIDASYYLNRFDFEQIDELLEASIDINHKENTAILLEYKNRLNRGNDLSLDW